MIFGSRLERDKSVQTRGIRLPNGVRGAADNPKFGMHAVVDHNHNVQVIDDEVYRCVFDPFG
jgi:hypothetical protein